MHRTAWRQLGQRHTTLLVLALVLALLAIAAAPAGAGPATPTLDLGELQTKLAASGPLDGYMKTALQGTTVTDVPVKVLAVVESFTWGKLIMFESTDPAITQIGGIAAGMSGSPVYVDDAGVDKLIGAVAWGEEFSLRGTGLATPIEYMTQLQDTYVGGAAAASAAPQRVVLDAPVATSTGSVDTIVLATGAKAAAGADAQPAATTAAAAAAGQAVMHPLALAQIGGLPTGSKAYKALAARLAQAGLTVVPAQASLLPVTSVTPALEAGSPCGVLFSQGFYWMGIMGTVTYVDGTSTLLFGHPILGNNFGFDLGVGAMEGILTGATVDAIWPSAAFPYKVMTPADTKGVAVQDRAAGVVALIGGTAQTFPVTTDVAIEGAGTHVVDVTEVGQWFGGDYAPGSVDEYGFTEPGAAGTVVSAGLYHALGSDATSGSATTTTTVVASNGSGTHTIVRENVWDADGGYWGIADLASGDVDEIVARLMADPYGLRDVTIQSVDVAANFSETRRYAGLADLTLPRALKVGDNTVVISYYRWGSPDLHTLETTLTLPAGTRLSGQLSVMPAAYATESGGFSLGDSSPAPAPQTLAEVEAALEAEPTNGDLLVSYTPVGSLFDDGPFPAAAAGSTVPTGWVFDGELSKQTATVELRAPRALLYGSPVLIVGMVEDATGDVSVDIYRRPAGAADPSTPAQTLTARYEEGIATFAAVLPPGRHNEVITAEVAALSADTLPGAAYRTVKVKAKLALSARRAGGRVFYSARVTPKDAGGVVQFQRRSAGRWITFKRANVDSTGAARAALATSGTPRVRARFAGSAVNAASAWVTAPAVR